MTPDSYLRSVLVDGTRQFRHRGVVRTLPGAIYSYVPASADDECARASIVHYRGPRKEWMAAEGANDKSAYRAGREQTHPELT